MQKRLNHKKSSKSRRAIIVLFLFLVLFLLLWFLGLRNNRNSTVESDTVVDSSEIDAPETTVVAKDTMFLKDSVDTVDTVKGISSIDSVVVPVNTEKKIKRIKKKEPPQVDTLKDTVSKMITPVDSVKDSITTDSVVNRCGEDTTALWVYPEPSGGLHRKSISVSFVSNRSCMIQYRFKDEVSWKKYEGVAVPVDKTTTILFDAIDSCGRVMEERQEFYEIEVENPDNPCSAGMEYVKLGGSQFCIDRFEWPNKRGVVPQAYVSLYQAMDSCYAVGKRLCTSEEWYMACSGPYGWKYPYGQIYEQNACSTRDTSVLKSGSKPECRGYYGNYDMSGSLLEWTSTKATENRQFNYVMGGFWESGPKSGCSDKKYSYFPENKHNPVGFRCCSDLPSGKNVSGGKVSK